jgi:hypothetical protein
MLSLMAAVRPLVAAHVRDELLNRLASRDWHSPHQGHSSLYTLCLETAAAEAYAYNLLSAI